MCSEVTTPLIVASHPHVVSTEAPGIEQSLATFLPGAMPGITAALANDSGVSTQDNLKYGNGTFKPPIGFSRTPSATMLIWRCSPRTLISKAGSMFVYQHHPVPEITRCIIATMSVHETIQTSEGCACWRDRLRRRVRHGKDTS
jgi:hypothetical protein